MRSKNSIVVALIGLFACAAAAQAPDETKVIAAANKVFDKAAKAATIPSPGCSVGVAVAGKSVFEKGFGLAEMEHDIPNTADTIFESGSVAKQFTAAAVVLLALDGKLSLDDPVKKYIPELPDYGSPLTIRHILHHTAGIRDWGSVMALTGNGRGDRMVSQELALDVITHQKSLDFTPGAEYSYSNSGYNLAATIVERVSKQKFGDFLAERLFKPLGMSHSSLRDDYQRIVPGRAQAYSRQGNGPWRLNMPFMNVYGNGGVLTTVGDWLKWNAMLDSRSFNPKLVDELETQGVLNDGRKIDYALGLQILDYHGIKEISHSGATAGYLTYLARFPEKRLSVALLCNGPPPSPNPVYAIVDELYGPYPETVPPAGITLTEDQLKKFAGAWRNLKTHNPNRFIFDNGVLKFQSTPVRAVSESVLMVGDAKFTFTFDKDGRPTTADVLNPDGSTARLAADPPWTPTADELKEWAGNWYSEEAGATFTFAVEGDKAFLVQRPSTKFPMAPLYRDHFSVAGYVMWVVRDKVGKIESLHAGGSRMRDMLFERIRK